MKKVPFNIPPVVGGELNYIAQTIGNRKLSGDGEFTKKCHEILQERVGVSKALLTTSGTHALEMAAILCNIAEGDEVIMPSFTFVSTANAFALRGAKIVFVDIRPDTMNIDEQLIERAITSKTKAIVPVHYAGVACEMDTIMEIAKENGLFVVEDAAQAIDSYYKDIPLGGIGNFGALSFHETKNISSGEGGAFLTKDTIYSEKAEIIREKGTNRSKFFRGEIDKYSWCDIGSSYLPSELNAAYLYAQLEHMEEITKHRLASWDLYNEGLRELVECGKIETGTIPADCKHNGHMFWLKARDLKQRMRLIDFLKENDVFAMFHYIPLHSSIAGKKLGEFHGKDIYTTKESERLLRLPMHYELDQEDCARVIELISEFYRQE